MSIVNVHQFPSTIVCQYDVGNLPILNSKIRIDLYKYTLLDPLQQARGSWRDTFDFVSRIRGI
jgi:hypothetical protein